MLTAAAGLAFLGLAVYGCGSGRHAGDRPRVTAPPAMPPTSATTSPMSITTTTVMATTTTVRAGNSVGWVALSVSRTGRPIGVRVFYPERRSGHPFPLIVFSPGYDIDPRVYDPLVTGWASLGFVVAVNEYPHTSAGAAGGLNEADIVQHPADLEATINELLATSGGSGSALSGLIDPSRIAVAGHSDGAVVTDATVSDSCCRDARIRAAVVMSGSELTSFGGTYRSASVPLLVVQGDSDTINAPVCSVQIYDTGGAPRFYLNLRGAGHLPPFTSDPSGVSYQQAVDRVTALFWRSYLDHDASAEKSLVSGDQVGPSASWAAGGGLTRVGACQGAPGTG